MDEWCDDSSMHEGHGVMRDTFLHEATLDIGTDPDKNRNATLLVSCQDLHTLGSEAEKRTFNTTILPKRHDWEVEYNTLHTWDVNMIYHHGFDGTKYTSLADPGSLDLAGGSWSQRCMTWYRQHIGTPALFGYRHVQSAWGGRASLSTGLESIVLPLPHVFSRHSQRRHCQALDLLRVLLDRRRLVEATGGDWTMETDGE
ncbi:uncharacterized protein LOC62_08G009844 [Vanrija pseudolonga]|uniref:Uncharacterized protein n=1 Tax=Vanrija pseudolonga TaxID=143232 RepID=A0AAF1BLV0_9TREE|nr:hypothetical protein LOC62_08G009844 [Vanrija pseudolonga]